MFPQIFGKYVLERELAAGGMARVYLATLRGAVGFEKRLVVKQIRPELALDDAFVRRFVEEAKIAVELSHPNIVPVYELGVEHGVYYIAMELCEGLTLTEVLLDTGPLDAAEGAYLGIEICRALDYAHRRGNIVHRDVTPRNVLLDEEGAVRLIDFGIAAPVSSPFDTARVEVFGSPGHMPIEQIRGERLSPATDVFAVGALLIEAWTGRPPFRRHSFEASAQALNEPLPSLALEHPELEPIAGVIAGTVAHSAADRPQEAEALARKLRDFSRQFDSGDVAKRLGARVCRARAEARSSTPWPVEEPSESGTPEVSEPASRAHEQRTPKAMSPLTAGASLGGTPVTRTFAAREDIGEWTRKLASLPPPAGNEPTVSVAPPGPGPSLVDEDEPATRAMPRSPVPLAPAKPFPWRIAGSVAALAVLVTGALASWRRPTPPGASSQPSLSSGRAVAPPRPVAAAVVSAELPILALAPSSTAAPLARPARSASAISAEAPSAQLRLTADPSATVTIVGGRVSQTHVTPVPGLKLPPGTYSVTFRSPTFGAPVVAQVVLGSASSRRVHADFRAAIPTVSVR